GEPFDGVCAPLIRQHGHNGWLSSIRHLLSSSHHLKATLRDGMIGTIVETGVMLPNEIRIGHASGDEVAKRHPGKSAIHPPTRTESRLLAATGALLDRIAPFGLSEEAEILVPVTGLITDGDGDSDPIASADKN